MVSAVRSTSFRFPSRDGIELEGCLHMPAPRPRAGVVLLHGITADMHESGFFTRLAQAFGDEGLAVLRFSFRGHGGSGGTQQGTTIAGEMLDALAAFDELRRHTEDIPLTAVGCSFGAVACSLVEHLVRPDRIVLLNPVLDLHRTFVEPITPWGKENFAHPRTIDGDLVMTSGFRLGPVLFEEMARYDVSCAFRRGTAPALVVHGDADSKVPYESTRQAALKRPRCTFERIEGADHGFANIGAQPAVIDRTVSFLSR